MKLYQNLWAGHPAYFLETSRSGSFRKGIGFWFNGRGEMYIDFNQTYYNSSFKENPERFPLLGKMTDAEFAQMVLGRFGIEKIQKERQMEVPAGNRSCKDSQESIAVNIVNDVERKWMSNGQA